MAVEKQRLQNLNESFEHNEKLHTLTKSWQTFRRDRCAKIRTDDRAVCANERDRKKHTKIEQNHRRPYTIQAAVKTMANQTKRSHITLRLHSIHQSANNPKKNYVIHFAHISLLKKNLFIYC